MRDLVINFFENCGDNLPLPAERYQICRNMLKLNHEQAWWIAMNPEWACLYFRVIAEGIRQQAGKQ